MDKLRSNRFTNAIAAILAFVVMHLTFMPSELAAIQEADFDTHVISMVENILENQEAPDGNDSSTERTELTTSVDLYYDHHTHDIDSLLKSINREVDLGTSGKPLAGILDTTIQPPEA